MSGHRKQLKYVGQCGSMSIVKAELWQETKKTLITQRTVFYLGKQLQQWPRSSFMGLFWLFS